jgi:hypothetical protein
MMGKPVVIIGGITSGLTITRQLGGRFSVVSAAAIFHQPLSEKVTITS